MLNLCSTYMKINKYTKINLRDFRHNLTQLKNSMVEGEVYRVYEKGTPLAYIIPEGYDIDLDIEQEKRAKAFKDSLSMPTGRIERPSNFEADREIKKIILEKYKK